MINISRVFGVGFAMLRQRFWLLAGMWLVFLAIQIAVSTVLGIAMVIMGASGMAAMGAGLEDPSALAGMGVGMIAISALVYAVSIAVVFAQQAAMVVLASPLEQPAFGAALVRGFKSVLPFAGLMLLIVLVYLAVSIAAAAVIGVLSFAGETAAVLAGGLMLLLAVPALIYAGGRLALLIAVVAVDEVYNPVAALRRAWGVTRGKVIGILLVLLATGLLALVVFGVPFALIFGAALSGADPSAATGTIMFGALLLFPMFVLYSLFAAAMAAALHAEVTDGGAERLEEVFA